MGIRLVFRLDVQLQRGENMITVGLKPGEISGYALCRKRHTFAGTANDRIRNATQKIFVRVAVREVMCLLAGLLWVPGVLAQTPDEHASHHPGATPATAGGPAVAGVGPPAGMGPPAGAGGPMAGMGEMMKNMGKPPPKQLYPSLMALPELTPEQRIEVEHAAAERMHAGTLLMGRALDEIKAGTQSGDYAAMHEATTRLREGVAQLESGITARRALAEGRAPRDVALAWFKREMRLTASASSDEVHGSRGLSVLHIFTMALLVIFAFAMLLMYFFKMRRAAALFRRIEPDAGSPPPGSSPPLGGGAGPSGEKPSNAGGSRPAKPGTDAAKDDQVPAPASAEKPPAPAAPNNSPMLPEPSVEKSTAPTPPPKAS
jgi:hypothetical protein